MAEVPLPTPTDNDVPSTDIRDAVYAGAMLDKVVTSTDLTYTDRLGGEHYTVDGIKAEGDKVVEKTRQNLIPLSRQYMTLAEAQADIANIPEGSTTYYRSPDDSAIAIEIMNVGGTLEPTGRKMPSQQAVDSAVAMAADEVKNRSELVVKADANKLSLITSGGFEIGEVSDEAIKVKNFGLTQSTDNLIEANNGEGFVLPIINAQGGLIAGGGTIVETPPGWQSVTMTPLGWVISGVQDDGTTYMGKDNGGAGGVEPTPSILETTAIGHWLFGYEDTSYNSRVGSKVLTPQSTPVFNKNFISLVAWGGALISDMPDSAEYTVCSVVRIPDQSPETDAVVIYGTANGYSQRDDDFTYNGIQLSLFSDRTTRRWIRSYISGYRATSRQYPADLSPVGKWLFISHTVRVAGSGQRYQVISVGGDNYNRLREADQNRVNLSGRNISIGNGYCDSAIFKTKQLDIAEFIYFNSALTVEQIKNVYLNSRQRMAERSLNLQ
ncbi:hypothetical protein VBQ74_04395 [Klebsiella pneumoniae]|nr:hypothetical protein [Klebsiella pneumoniae]